MEYRAFGPLGWRPSALGFGCMRFPRRTDGSGEIDAAAATEMLRYAIDQGVNYLDTAHVYPGSEQVMGEALAGGYREKVRLATKLPVWDVKTTADADRIFTEQLVRLQTGHIDFYLFHGLHEQRWARIKELGLLGWAERKVAEGLIGHIGFSFHASPRALKDIIDGYDGWTLCQVQYNYLDTTNQAGTEGLEYAHGKGLAIVIMEPLRGGLLATPPSDEIKALFEAGPVGQERTPADLALQWLWSRPEVSLVLSGMSTLEQVVENVASAERSKVGLLGPEELRLCERLAEAYRSRTAVPCTFCGYCRVCPEGLDLPRVFGIYNDACIRLPDRSRFERIAKIYPNWPAEMRVERCTECGTCEEVCSQRMPVREYVKKVAADYGVAKEESAKPSATG